MALEPRTVTAEEIENPELIDMKRRFGISAALTAPLLLLAMGHMLPGFGFVHAIPVRTRAFLELALATPVAVWGAWPFYQRAVASVRSRSLNMFTLIGLGISAPTATASSRRSHRRFSLRRFASRTDRSGSTSSRRPSSRR
jgi:Cu+-exporting ATPase